MVHFHLNAGLWAALVALTSLQSCSADKRVDLIVRPNGGNVSSPIMYGLMHEDINNSGDGGIYAELIRNRAFQSGDESRYPVTLDGWSPVEGAKLSLKKLSKPLSSALPYSMNVAVPSSKDKKARKVGFANDGYWGMDVRKQKYTGSFYVKGAYQGKSFTASLQSALTGEVFGTTEVPAKKKASNDWVKYDFNLTPFKAARNSNNTFAITFDAAGAKDGSLDFNLISLFPPTYKNRPNGLRVDLMEALAALKPKFLRFPGGNMLEGNTLPTWWKWNETIGDLKDRPGQSGVWGYPTTSGLGLVEYMQWADDLNLEPILAVWGGLALDGGELPESRIDEAVQSALDEMEFLTGDASTHWGGIRAKILGHKRPWKIRYVEIGNEDWLAGGAVGYENYKRYRFPAFFKAFQEKYPKVQLIASPSVFDNMTIPKPAAGDYHPYLTPDNMVKAFNKFDALSRDNLTLIGEAASTHPNGGIGWDGNLMPFPWWGGSVAEAIFLLGLERNGDKVIGTTYAPGLRNLNRWQWSMTQIQHAADPALTTLSTSYHVWKLLGETAITKTLPITAKAGGIDPLFYVAGETESGSNVFKAAVYNSTEPIAVSVQFAGLAGKVKQPAKKPATATLTVLTGPANPYGYNDPWKHNNVVKETKTKLKAKEGGTFSFTLPQLSVAVLETDSK
ncbi:glycoside hydrolase superfamily [Sordaria brevicollis]|uniref:non-reducing end alpha-L-arabinofuranosidase n=1 Tax=Sordaria brevicollis TaxID=83679 RepID=A0AAE0U5Z4_SORBR|nr:glycoside hydrolase superfamily [Sordaria brevicollis]